jgi:hypothetical protein
MHSLKLLTLSLGDLGRYAQLQHPLYHLSNTFTDLNYRIDLPDEEVRSLLTREPRGHENSTLLAHDQVRAPLSLLVASFPGALMFIAAQNGSSSQEGVHGLCRA